MKQFKPQAYYYLLLIIILHFGCAKDDEAFNTTQKSNNNAADSNALSSSKWRHLATWNNEFGSDVRDIKPYEYDTSYTEILTERQFIRFDKKFNRSYSYPFITPSAGIVRFNLHNSFYYTTAKNSLGYPKENIIAQHYTGTSSVSTILSTVQQFIGDTTPGLIYTLIANDIDFAAYHVYHPDSTNNYVVVFQFRDRKAIRTQIDEIDWSKSMIYIQKSMYGLMIQYMNTLFMIDDKGTIKHTGIITNTQKLIGVNNTGDYLVHNIQTGKLQTTLDCITWQDVYPDIKVHTALQSFDKRYLLTTQRNELDMSKDVTIIDLELNKRFTFNDKEDLDYTRFWIKGNILYLLNSDGFYGRLLK